MAGQKPSEQEKQQILDLVKQGYNIEEIQSRFAHVDGRNISGLHMRHTRRAPPPQATPDFALPPPVPASGGPMPGSAPVSVPSPMPHEPYKTPQQDAAESTGFTPSPTVSHTPQGFKPGYREYFVIKKLDPPGDGVMKTEYPPFSIQDLMDRYAHGDYEIQHYREGRLFNTYREKIAMKSSFSSTSQISRESAKPASPADDFLKAMDVYHRMHTEGKNEAASARSVEAHAKVEETRAKAQVETAATVGLIDLVKELGRPKPTGNEGSIEKLFSLMQEDRKTVETKLKSEIDMMRERSKIDLEFERERMKGETERAKADAEERLKRERLFMEKLGELDKDRQTLWKESYDNMVGEIKGMQESLSRELEEKRKWLDQYNDLQKKHTDEIVSLKKTFAGGGDSLKMAELIKDGVVQGLDRVGARIDMLADKGLIGPVKNPGDKTVISAGQSHADPKKEEKAVLTKEAIESAVKEKWFQDLQDEIARTIRRRKTVSDQRLKPHGTLLGQAFIDQMNQDVTMRKYMHYLCSREWSEVLSDAEPGFKAENKETLHDPEAAVWFVEFQMFLTAAWNSSIGVSK
ncbi:MAG: hypothetical protein ACRD1Z_12765 [Vicinamibacteria bacterium]